MLIANLIKKFIDLVPAAVWFGLLIAAALLAGLQTVRHDQARQAATIYKLDAENLKAAQARNLKTIAELQAANLACISGREADRVEYAQAAANIARERARMDAQAAKLRERLTDALQTPDCAALGAVRLADSCPALASRLRDSEALYYAD